MAYAPYLIRVIARATITKVGMGAGTPRELVAAYPEEEQVRILAEVYAMRPDLEEK